MKTGLEQQRDKSHERYERAETNNRIAKIVGVALIAVFALVIYITQTNDNTHYSEGWIILGVTPLLFIGIFLCYLDFHLG